MSFENQIKQDKVNQMIQEEKEFSEKFTAIFTNLQDQHKKREHNIKKMLQQGKQFLENLAKKQEQNINLEKRKRLEALKAQEMSKYLDLLKDSKENRIMEVLKETENFLKEIALRIKHSKQDITTFEPYPFQE